jgi:hypothetical protein
MQIKKNWLIPFSSLEIEKWSFLRASRDGEMEARLMKWEKKLN